MRPVTEKCTAKTPVYYLELTNTKFQRKRVCKTRTRCSTLVMLTPYDSSKTVALLKNSGKINSRAAKDYYSVQNVCSLCTNLFSTNKKAVRRFQFFSNFELTNLTSTKFWA